MSALPPKAGIAEREHHVRFVPKADSCSAALNCNEKGTCDEGPIIGLINTGSDDLRYLGISTVGGVDVVDYPDSTKIAVAARVKPTSRLQPMSF